MSERRVVRVREVMKTEFDRVDSMDLVQEASLQAYKSIGTFEPGTNFKAWFMRILTNKF